ncbi:MAG: low molecular weight protein-tyrosine-phosphatase [Gammaproteobacteria bacterium]|nr:low molecular weight protein-tyrosine-phosphatase [Gammaproteobacteria bacterium]
MATRHRILFVCMGNICRSPTAHGVFLKLLEQEGEGLLVEVDSAGTHSYHIGSAPDRRSAETARRRGYDLSPLRARQVDPDDFERFDLLLAMDSANYRHLLGMASEEHHPRVKMFLEFAENYEDTDVPDPYYGGDRGFEHVLDLVEDASRGLLRYLRER